MKHIVLYLLIGIFAALLVIMLYKNMNAVIPYNHYEPMTGLDYPTTLGTNINHVFENVYFDETNGNLLEISIDYLNKNSAPATELMGIAPAPAPAEVEAESVPAPAPAPASEPTDNSTGITIKTIYGRDRGNKIDTTRYSINNEAGTVLSSTASTDAVASSYETFVVTTSHLQFFYIAWDKATIIHVIDLTIPPNSKNPTHVCTFVSDKNSGLVAPIVTKYSPPSNNIDINTQTYSLGLSDNRYTMIPVYDTKKTIFRIVDGVFYDPTNGSLITQTADGFNIYARETQNKCEPPSPSFVSMNNDPKTGTSSTIVDIGACTWFVKARTFIVLYIAIGKRTSVVILNKETNANKYNLVSAVRFMNNGTLDSGNSNAQMSANIDIDITKNEWYNIHNYGKDVRKEDGKNDISDFYKWADYWNTISGTDLYENIKDSKYMLKTQVVPPVCPRCPNCPGSGVCTTCGGKGGSGTSAPSLAPSGSSDKKDDAPENVGEFLEDTGKGVKDLAIQTGKGVKDVAYDAAGGVKDVAYDAAKGVKDVAYDVVGGTKDVVGDVVGGVKDVVGDVAGGVKGLFSGSGVRVRDPNLGMDGTQVGQHLGGAGNGVGHGNGNAQFGIYTKTPQTQGSDFMTYFGALQPKGGANYIPITADFSAFGR